MRIWGALLLCLASSPLQAQDRVRTPSIRIPTEEALRIAFMDVCLASATSGRPVEELARARRLIGVSPQSAGATKADKAWRLRLQGPIWVVAWADGTCSAAVQTGDAEVHAAAVQAMIREAGLKVSAGVAYDVDAGGRRTAYCTDDVRPVVVAVTTRPLGPHRPVLLTTVFRARGERPAFCPPLTAKA